MAPLRRSLAMLLAAASPLLVAGPPAAAQEEQAEKEKQEKKIEKRVIVIDDEDGPGHRLEALGVLGELARHDLECHEENGKEICIARAAAGPFGIGTFLGVELAQMTPELREHMRAPREAGVLLSRIEEDSPAARAGLEVGDVVTAVDGEAIESPMDLRRAIRQHQGGDTVTIELYRDGRLEQVTATLQKREPRDFVRHLRIPHPALDEEAIAEQVREALAEIDFEKLSADVQKALEGIDWSKIQAAVDQALEQAFENEER